MPTKIIHAGAKEPNLLKPNNPCFEFSEHQLRIESTYGGNAMFTLLDDVQVLGKSVSFFSFDVLKDFAPATAWQLLDAHLGGVTPAKLRAYLLEIERRHPYDGSCDVLEGLDGQRVFRQKLRSTAVYAELALPRIPKLKELPVKWTLAHVKRALANGQYKDLHCDGQYSDDYARDALNNYDIGPVALQSVLAPVIESGATSGWRTSICPKTLKVFVNQHSFNRNSFTLVL